MTDASSVFTMIKQACIDDESSHDNIMISLKKLNAFVDLYYYYPTMKKGDIKNQRELYKIMSQMKGSNKVSMEISGVPDYTIGYSNLKNGSRGQSENGREPYKFIVEP